VAAGINLPPQQADSPCLTFPGAITSFAFSDIAVDVVNLEESGKAHQVNEWNNILVESLKIEQAQHLVCPALQLVLTLLHDEPRTLH